MPHTNPSSWVWSGPVNLKGCHSGDYITVCQRDLQIQLRSMITWLWVGFGFIRREISLVRLTQSDGPFKEGEALKRCSPVGLRRCRLPGCGEGYRVRTWEQPLGVEHGPWSTAGEEMGGSGRKWDLSQTTTGNKLSSNWNELGSGLWVPNKDAAIWHLDFSPVWPRAEDPVKMCYPPDPIETVTSYICFSF